MWATIAYEGERLHLVFTTPTGGLVLSQTVAKVMKQAAKTARITARLGTHAGRRTVVTTVFVEGDEALEDIARLVGHAKPWGCSAQWVQRRWIAGSVWVVAFRRGVVLWARFWLGAGC